MPWSVVGPELVRLEHLRFGEDHPVYLFDLAPLTANSWCSVSPHLCMEDCYSAELQLQWWGLLKRCVITGPRKQERIQYEYLTTMQDHLPGLSRDHVIPTSRCSRRGCFVLIPRARGRFEIEAMRELGRRAGHVAPPQA